MKKTTKTIISIAAALILFVIISNLIVLIIGTSSIIPCRTSPLVPPFTQPTGPYNKMCYVGQSPLPWVISGALLVGSMIDYQQTYYVLFWILFCLISAVIPILIVWLFWRTKKK
jgi:hypothetical protein